MKLENVKIVYGGEIEHEKMKDITKIIDDFDLEMGANIEMSMRVTSDSSRGKIEFRPVGKTANVECKIYELPDNYRCSLFLGISNDPARLIIKEYSKERSDIRVRDYVIYTAPEGIKCLAPSQ